MNTITKYYADAYGPDIKALVACVRKAFELADSIVILKITLCK